MNKSDETIDAFISYQSADETFAKKLAAGIESYVLNERKLKAFFAPWDIKPGDNFIAKINEALEKARFFIIILSTQALQAEWPTAERDAAVYADPSGRLGRVIPVLRESCRIPPLLRFRSYLDFRDDSRFESELTRLLCVLTGESLPREHTPLGLYKAAVQKRTDKTRSPPTSVGESWMPDPVNEEICCNLFPVNTLPPKIWSPPCIVSGPIPNYFEPEVIIPPHIRREKRLFTFVDLSKENNVFRGVVEDYDIKSIDTAEWFKDEVHSRWLVELLGWGIDKHRRKLGLSFDDVGKKYFYNKDVVLKEVKWTPSKKRVSKELIIFYKGYAAHRAVQLKFEVIGTLIFLKINTGWTFTYDGYKPIRGLKGQFFQQSFCQNRGTVQISMKYVSGLGFSRKTERGLGWILADRTLKLMSSRFQHRSWEEFSGTTRSSQRLSLGRPRFSRRLWARGVMSLRSNKIATATVLEEPMLLFGGSFPAVDPKLGISLYGPYSTEKTIKIGIVGDKDTISQVCTILEHIKKPIEGPAKHPLWTPDFPGMPPDSPFRCELLTSQDWWQTITSKDVEPLDRFYHVKQRISLAVNIFFNYVKNLKEREGGLDIVICAPPKRMMDLCITAEESRLRRSLARRWKPRTKKRESFKPGQTYLTDFLPEIKEDQYLQAFQRTADNFHHFLKARIMGLDVLTQLILPYTLNAYTLPNQKPMQDDATFAWNLSVALLYKAGGRPWRPDKIPTGTCFIGISFYRERQVFGGQIGTSVAQIFTPEGEGLVLKGDRFSWPHRRSPNLKKDSAKRLIEKALALYEQHTHLKPSRVVIHKSSKYTEEEMEGFEEALGDVHQQDFLTIAKKEKGIRFFRLGYNPIIRGTKIAFPDGTWLLYTKAYIPFLRVYPGPRVPLPLEIIQHIGDSPPETLSREILMLTKLNMNSADFCSHFPMTLEFSKRVGSILKELPPGRSPQSKYMFYM